MRIEIAYVTPRRGRLKSAPAQALLEDFRTRAARYTPVQTAAYDTEAALLASVEKAAARSPVPLILLDSRGEALTSETIAQRLGRLRDAGTQQVTMAIGPADGWSAAALGRASFRLSFGAITLPHELALVVLAEQVYRALAILAGHPYHSGHS
ncbi:MAG TPA: 23S rRNA (pseudouridine(1915)-N(3))-methyltransferase RlmH [Acidobacteriaceae bacterium]|nr:23S rRNA (pseudouridine(1915)-N(3))-methyltransferase RlmH [Acidobacteriaceae bacterium]